MRRRRLLFSIALILGFIALVLVGLAVAAKREPSFYRQAGLPAGPERAILSQQAVAKYFEISGQLDESSWQVSFSTEQVNAFFQEDYFKFGGDDNWPEGVHSPRVKIEDGKMRFGFRYGSGPTATVVSLEIRLWKVANELNMIAMEIVGFQAGSLPLPTGSLLDLISQLARREKIDISWFRQDGHPVAVMRFQSDLSRPTFQIDRIELKDGTATISGRSTESPGIPTPRVVKP
jgi:hypothetical protein